MSAGGGGVAWEGDRVEGCELELAVRKLQRAFRHWSEYRRMREAQKMRRRMSVFGPAWDEAATTIQSGYRGYAARKRVKETRKAVQSIAPANLSVAVVGRDVVRLAVVTILVAQMHGCGVNSVRNCRHSNNFTNASSTCQHPHSEHLSGLQNTTTLRPAQGALLALEPQSRLLSSLACR